MSRTVFDRYMYDPLVFEAVGRPPPPPRIRAARRVPPTDCFSRASSRCHALGGVGWGGGRFGECCGLGGVWWACRGICVFMCCEEEKGCLMGERTSTVVVVLVDDVVLLTEYVSPSEVWEVLGRGEWLCGVHNHVAGLGVPPRWVSAWVPVSSVLRVEVRERVAP